MFKRNLSFDLSPCLLLPSSLIVVVVFSSQSADKLPDVLIAVNPGFNVEEWITLYLMILVALSGFLKSLDICLAILLRQ